MKDSEDLLTERRRSHGPSAFGTFQQGSSDVAFQAADLSDQRRLRDAEMLGGLAQCLVADGGGEPVQSLPGVRAGQCLADRNSEVGGLVDVTFVERPVRRILRSRFSFLRYLRRSRAVAGENLANVGGLSSNASRCPLDNWARTTLARSSSSLDGPGLSGIT